MANVKSTYIQNAEATPLVRNNPAKGPAVLKSVTETLEVSTSEDATHKLYFFRVPSNASPRELRVWADASISSGAMDIGLYRTTADGGAVVDADFFASALAVGSGLTGADQMFESGIIDEAEVGTAIWQMLGLSEDPHLVYDVIGTITTDMGAAGTLSMELRYVDAS